MILAKASEVTDAPNRPVCATLHQDTAGEGCITKYTTEKAWKS